MNKTRVMFYTSIILLVSSLSYLALYTYSHYNPLVDPCKTFSDQTSEVMGVEIYKDGKPMATIDCRKK